MVKELMKRERICRWITSTYIWITTASRSHIETELHVTVVTRYKMAQSKIILKLQEK